MSDQRSRLGAANLSLPLMIVSFVVIAGFLVWLGMNAESVEVVVQDRGAAETETLGDAFVEVTEQQLREAPEQIEGQVVQASRLPVAMAVGEQAFFLDLPDSPFLVKLGPELLEEGRTVPQGGTVTVSGPLLAMTDSIIADWMERGIIAPADEILVEFATHFIEARSVEVVPPEGGDGADEDDDGGDP